MNPEPKMNELHIVIDDDGTFVTYADVSLVYGHGDSPSEAWDDYVVSLKEYIKIVDSELPDPGAVREGAELRAHLKALSGEVYSA